MIDNPHPKWSFAWREWRGEFPVIFTRKDGGLVYEHNVRARSRMQALDIAAKIAPDCTARIPVRRRDDQETT